MERQGGKPRRPRSSRYNTCVTRGETWVWKTRLSTDACIMVRHRSGRDKHHHRLSGTISLSAWVGGLRLHCYFCKCSFLLWASIHVHIWARKWKSHNGRCASSLHALNQLHSRRIPSLLCLADQSGFDTSYRSCGSLTNVVLSTDRRSIFYGLLAFKACLYPQPHHANRLVHHWMYNCRPDVFGRQWRWHEHRCWLCGCSTLSRRHRHFWYCYCPHI